MKNVMAASTSPRGAHRVMAQEAISPGSIHRMTRGVVATMDLWPMVLSPACVVHHKEWVQR